MLREPGGGTSISLRAWGRGTPKPLVEMARCNVRGKDHQIQRLGDGRSSF